MKVINKVVLALFLAAPLNMVSANEKVFSMEPVKTIGGDNYIERLKEVKILTPMTYADVVVVAPDIKDRDIRFVYISHNQIRLDKMSVSTELAF